MLVVRLSSGIGNQLFQYAFALYIKEYYQDTVYLECSSFKYCTAKRQCAIDIISDLPTLSDKRIYYNYRSLFFYISKALFRLNPFVKRITDSNLHFPKNDRFLYFDGYWQSDFFTSDLVGVMGFFKPKEAMPAFLNAYLDDIRSSNAVSLHVRRGDYFSDEFRHRYGVCNADYYQKAMDLLSEGVENPKVFVFSDDMDWVKENIKHPANTVCIRNEEINPYWYVYLMSKCRDHIISNSSFSWWGAYLNENPQKRVVAPKEWMVGEKGTLALDGWITL